MQAETFISCIKVDATHYDTHAAVLSQDILAFQVIAVIIASRFDGTFDAFLDGAEAPLPTSASPRRNVSSRRHAGDDD